MSGLTKKYCVFGCDHLTQQNTPQHRFPHPVRQSELFAAWVSAVGGKLLQMDHMKIYKNKKICDHHFEPSQKACSRRLIRSAIPTINLEGVRQSTASIVDLDHSYSHHRRELEQLQPMTPGTSTSEYLSIVESTVNPMPSASTSTNTVESAAKEDSVMDKNTTGATNDPCYDNSNDYDDDDDDDVVVVPNAPVPESEELSEILFSWDKTDTIIADDTMLVSDLTVAGRDVTLECGDVSMYNDERSLKDDDIGSQPSNYRCNECGETITGFRYTCVQCADWDLCAACEARAAHDAHYVLRVPGHRPYKEVQAILTAVRQHMFSEMFLIEMMSSIKEEVKDDETEVPEGVTEPEGDPLGAWNISQYDDDCDTLENNPDPNKDGRPPQNRRRTSLESITNIQNFTPRDDSSCVNPITVTDGEPMETNEDGTRSDDSQTSETRFDYSLPIQIIDIDKLTKSHEQTRQDTDMYTDIIQITKENGIEMLADRLDDILDTPKLQQTEPKELVDMSNLKTLKHTSHINDATHNERIKQSKEIGTHAKGTGAKSEGTETFSQTKVGTRSKRITRSNHVTKKRYKILLPPGDHWKQLLMTMLKSRATVQLTDVMQKRNAHKKTELNDI